MFGLFLSALCIFPVAMPLSPEFFDAIHIPALVSLNYDRILLHNQR